MNLRKHLLFAIPLALLFVTGPARSQAQDFAKQHPAYIHALEDLRLMRGYMDRLNPSEHIDDESVRCVREIDAAINEIKAAAIDDHRDLHEHPPIDAHIRPTDRFHKAREAGNAALRDLNYEEDDRFANGLKHRAMEHVKAAVQITDGLIHRYEHGN